MTSARWLTPSRKALPFPLAMVLPLVLSLPLRAESFQVYCVSNNDGTVTCEGWRGGETLTCVSSQGRVNTCSTPSGRPFTCLIDPGGVTSCSDSHADRPPNDDTNCTFTGDGNFTCQPPKPASPPLLPGPRLPESPTLPPLPRSSPVITNPSVFDP
jgi:hypothetical protein